MAPGGSRILGGAMADRIAFFALGVLKAPVGDPQVQGFIDRLGDVYAAAEGSAGFFERSVRDVETWAHSWGPVMKRQDPAPRTAGTNG
jgi:hypothetical protein